MSYFKCRELIIPSLRQLVSVVRSSGSVVLIACFPDQAVPFHSDQVVAELFCRYHFSLHTLNLHICLGKTSQNPVCDPLDIVCAATLTVKQNPVAHFILVL